MRKSSITYLRFLLKRYDLEPGGRRHAFGIAFVVLQPL